MVELAATVLVVICAMALVWLLIDLGDEYRHRRHNREARDYERFPED